MAAISEHPLATAVGLYDHYESIAEVKHYYGVLAIYALARTAEAVGDEALWQRVERILRRFPDEIDHPRYNFPSYRIGGVAQSFMVSSGRMADRLELVREYADELMTAPRDADGILTLINQPDDKIWVDVAMAATPYLLFAGQVFGEQRYLDEAVHQAVAMYDAFFDPVTGLLHQCKNFIAPGVLSTDHWSRGNGWGYIALTELIRGLPSDSEHRPEVEKRFVALSEAMVPHQSPNGLWRQEIPMVEAWEESSGSGLIAYGIGVGIETGVLAADRWRPVLARAIRGLGSHAINADHSTELSCPGTLCPGEGEGRGTPTAYVELRSPYRDEPHSFAPLMLALTQAGMAGIETITLGPPGPERDQRP